MLWLAYSRYDGGYYFKLLKALCDELHYRSIAEGTEKKL